MYSIIPVALAVRWWSSELLYRYPLQDSNGPTWVGLKLFIETTRLEEETRMRMENVRTMRGGRLFVKTAVEGEGARDMEGDKDGTK